MTSPRLALLALLALLLHECGASRTLGEGHWESEPGVRLPVVMWHGMGDWCCGAESMGAVRQRIEQALPGSTGLTHRAYPCPAHRRPSSSSRAPPRRAGVYVLSVSTGAGATRDVLSGFFGLVDAQVEAVCKQLRGDKRLEGGYVAVGFSQASAPG